MEITMRIRIICILLMITISISCCVRLIVKKEVVFENCNLDKSELRNSKIAFFPLIFKYDEGVDCNHISHVYNDLRERGNKNVIHPNEVEMILQKYNLIEVYYDFINEFLSSSIINKEYLQKLNLFLDCDYFLILQSFNTSDTAGYFKVFIFDLKTYDLKYSTKKGSKTGISWIIRWELEDLGVLI